MAFSRRFRKPIATVDDLGLGTRDSDSRNVNKDGSFNVQRVGAEKFKPYEIYHRLISMSWRKFIFGIFVLYFVMNVFFAIIYYFIGIEHLAGIDTSGTEAQKISDAFFFSSQTLTTLGYGRIAPVGALTSSVAAIESMLGLMGFALATGLLYGRFSRPEAKIVYSSKAIIAPYKNITAFMFRICNQRSNQLIEVEAEITLAYTEPGKTTRSYLAVPLERKKINLFPLSWTLVHPIDENSPFFGLEEMDIREMKAEFIILIKAFDDTFSQTVYSRSSYRSEEIIFGAKFLPMFSQQANGITRLDLGLIDAMEHVELPKPEIQKLDAGEEQEQIKA
jgi:inward rectifier potassium channel